MQSKRFGVAWTVHQTFPFYVAKHLQRGDMATREALLLSLHALAQVLPCKLCRRSYRNFVRDVQLDRRLQHTLGDSVQFARVLFDLHNLVNQKLQKPQATSFSDYVVAAGADQFRCALLDWLCTIATNYSKFDAQIAAHPTLRSAIHRAQLLLQQREPSVWLRKSMLQRQSLLAFVDAMAFDLWPGRAAATADRALLDAWRKIWWHMVYFDALLRLLHSSGQHRLVHCGTALRNATVTGGDNETCSALFESSDAMFCALYNVRRRCAWPESCDSLQALKERFESYRAGGCKGQTCD